MLRLFCLIIATSILHSCMRGKEMSETEKNDVTKASEKILNDYLSDVRENGLSAEFKYLDSSADFFWVPPGYRSALTYDSVRSILEQNAKSYRTFDLKWQNLKILPLANNLANYTGSALGSMVDTSGISTTLSMIETGTLIKRPDGWKLLCGQTAAVTF